MTALETLGLVVAGAAVFMAALLAAAETSVQRMSVVRALRLNEEERRGSDALVWVAEHRARALNVLLLLTVVSRVIAAGIVVVILARRMSGVAAVAAATGAVAGVSYVVAEALPRTFTLTRLERVSLLLAPLTRATTRALAPIADALTLIAKRLVVGGRQLSGPYAADEELGDLASEEDEPIEADERQMIHSIFELGDTRVSDIMVPRPDMVMLDAAAELGAVMDTIVKRGYSRLPVYRANRDEIIGVLYGKDVMRLVSEKPEESNWLSIVRPPTLVPEAKRVDDLLRELQRNKVHLALAVDEYGAISGLVTIEDILEEIVGEIVDEHDVEQPLVETLAAGNYRIDARLQVDELNQLLDCDLPDEDWTTVGGLMFGMLGRIPEPGEQMSIDGLTLIAEQLQGRRISKILVHANKSE